MQRVSIDAVVSEAEAPALSAEGISLSLLKLQQGSIRQYRDLECRDSHLDFDLAAGTSFPVLRKIMADIGLRLYLYKSFQMECHALSEHL